MVAYAAEFIAHDAVFAGAVRLDGYDHVVTRVNLDVDVDRLQGETVLPIQGGNMQTIGLIFLKFD